MLGIKKQKASAGIPIWQSKNTQVAQGGFTLIGGTPNTEIPAGTVIACDEETRTASVVSAVDEMKAVNGLLYSTVTTDENGNIDVAVALRGTVYENRIPEISEEVKAKLPLIIFSKSF